MNTGKLTPRSNNTVEEMRFSGGFAQPDGFASVLNVKVNKAGDACLGLTYRSGIMGEDREKSWSITLTNEQRIVLAGMLGRYQPRIYETVITDGKANDE